MNPRAAVTIIFAVNGLLYGAWASRIAAVGDRLHLGAGELGIALAFIAAGALMAMPIAGRAANRFGSTPATTVSLALFCVASALTPAAPSLALLCAACVLMGAAGGALDVTMNVQGVTVEDSGERPILSSFHAAFSAGGLTGALIGAASAGLGIDVRAQMVVLAALGLVVGLTAARSLLPAAADAVGKRDRDVPRPRRIDSRLLLLGLLAFFCLLCEGAAADWSAVYVDRSLAASAAVAGLAYAAFSVTMVLGRLFGDALTERFGSAALVRGGSVISAVGLAAALVANAPGAALVGFACLGAGLSIVVPQVFRAAAATGDSGPALATVSTIGYTGFLAGPPLIGALAELTSLPVALALLPVLAAAMALLAPLTQTRSAQASAPECELQPS